MGGGTGDGNGEVRNTRYTEKDLSINNLEECKKLIGHQDYRDYHFYSFNFYLEKEKKETREFVFSSESLHNSNLLDLLSRSLDEGRFIDLKEITMREYAKEGGTDIPWCVKYCKFIRKGTPRCVIGFDN